MTDDVRLLVAGKIYCVLEQDLKELLAPETETQLLAVQTIRTLERLIGLLNNEITVNVNKGE